MRKSWFVGLVTFVVAGAAYALPQRTEIDVTDVDGAKIGKVVLCSDCKDAAKVDTPECPSGAAEGWRDGAPCGSCLLQANWGKTIEYSRDLQVSGTLVGADGEPIAERYVKMFLPNGWSIRTRTAADGTFRLLLGATKERTGTEPIKVDIGQRTDTVKGDDPNYTIYLVPTDYKPCADAAPMKRAPVIDPERL